MPPFGQIIQHYWSISIIVSKTHKSILFPSAQPSTPSLSNFICNLKPILTGRSQPQQKISKTEISLISHKALILSHPDLYIDTDVQNKPIKTVLCINFLTEVSERNKIK